jgi:hypothetical protein
MSLEQDILDILDDDNYRKKCANDLEYAKKHNLVKYSFADYPLLHFKEEVSVGGGEDFENCEYKINRVEEVHKGFITGKECPKAKKDEPPPAENQAKAQAVEEVGDGDGVIILKPGDPDADPPDPEYDCPSTTLPFLESGKFRYKLATNEPRADLKTYEIEIDFEKLIKATGYTRCAVAGGGKGNIVGQSLINTECAGDFYPTYKCYKVENKWDTSDNDPGCAWDWSGGGIDPNLNKHIDLVASSLSIAGSHYIIKELGGEDQLPTHNIIYNEDSTIDVDAQKLFKKVCVTKGNPPKVEASKDKAEFRDYTKPVIGHAFGFKLQKIPKMVGEPEFLPPDPNLLPKNSTIVPGLKYYRKTNNPAVYCVATPGQRASWEKACKELNHTAPTEPPPYWYESGKPNKLPPWACIPGNEVYGKVKLKYEMHWGILSHKPRVAVGEKHGQFIVQYVEQDIIHWSDIRDTLSGQLHDIASSPLLWIRPFFNGIMPEENADQLLETFITWKDNQPGPITDLRPFLNFMTDLFFNTEFYHAIGLRFGDIEVEKAHIATIAAIVLLAGILQQEENPLKCAQACIEAASESYTVAKFKVSKSKL